MGKKLDALFGRHFKSSKFKALVNVAVSRLSVLKNQRRSRCSLARSDVVELLNLAHHDRALLRVEQVIKEQNMLDVFVMIEGYFHLLVERINLIEREKVCPEELKEAVSSLLFASTRCGEFPELQEMRAVLTSQFGKEFAGCAIELRNNCGVNLKMVQKLSTRQPSLENRMKVLKEIASENNIILQIEETSSEATEEKLEIEEKQNQHNIPDEIENMEGLSDSMKTTRKYKDVADAAEAAFKSAAYAAAAARAAVELSRPESHDPDDQNSPHPEQRKISDKHDAIKCTLQTTDENNLRRTEDQNVGLGFEKVHPIQNYHSESEDEIHCEKKAEESEESKNVADFKGSRPTEDTISDESGDETRNEQGGVQLSRTQDSAFHMKPSLLMNESFDSGKSCTVEDEEDLSKDSAVISRSQKKFPLRSQAGLKAESGPGYPKAEKRPISVRTRRAQGR
ncbi:unnamed protein product [Camellia sinensis]